MMKKEGKSFKANGKLVPETRKDRKSATGVNGSPKKGGHGGKFTWSGADGYSPVELGSFNEESAIDEKDPNIEDPNDVVVVKAV